VFKEEGRGSWGSCSGKADEDHGGCCAAGGAGRKKGKEKRTLPRGAKWSERERERAEEEAVRAGPSWAARGEEEKEDRAGAEWASAREERWATGKEAGLRGREGKQAGLG
jgi:hypothetical protein